VLYFFYNASAVKIDSATSSLVRFEFNNIFVDFGKNALAYNSAGVVAVNSKVVGRLPGLLATDGTPGLPDGLFSNQKFEFLSILEGFATTIWSIGNI
jgi:hypothetical protein